jgi:TolB-like protein
MAIQAYERCRAVLAELMDAAPSAETEKLLTEIRGPSASSRPMIRRPRPATDGGQDNLTHLAPRFEPTSNRGGARIGVAPFQMVGTSEDDAHLAPGLAGEITTALSRFRWLFVVLLGNLDKLPPEQRDDRAMRNNFGIDFLVDGSVQRVGTRLRVTVRLVDLRNANQVVWARRFDRQSDDLLTLQDEVAAEVVAQIDPEILLIEANRVSAQPLVDSTAYDLVLRAMPLIWRMEREPYMQAGTYLRKALELEPDYASGHAWMAVWYNFYVGQGWADDPAAGITRGGEHAERAVALDPLDARGLTIAGHIRAFLHRRPHEALPLHDRALQLNPNLAMAWGLSSFAHIYLGNLDEAEIRANRYKRLSPLDPNEFFFDTAFIQIGLLKRDYESAVVVGRSLSQLNPGFSNMLKPYLACLGHLRYSQESSVIRKRLMDVEPTFTVARYKESSPLTLDRDRDHVALGLELAGVPKGD